jgi:hypothetical protein
MAASRPESNRSCRRDPGNRCQSADDQGLSGRRSRQRQAFPDGSKIVKLEWKPKKITSLPFSEKTPDTVSGDLEERGRVKQGADATQEAMQKANRAKAPCLRMQLDGRILSANA